MLVEVCPPDKHLKEHHTGMVFKFLFSCGSFPIEFYSKSKKCAIYYHWYWCQGLDGLDKFCSKWGIEINQAKTKIIKFQLKGDRLVAPTNF